MAADQDLDALVSLVTNRLGYAGRDGLLLPGDDYPHDANRHVVRQAFDRMGVSAIYGLNSGDVRSGTRYAPLVYVAVAHGDAEARRINLAVWTQGAAPILLITRLEGLEIRNGFESADQVPVLVGWDRVRAPTSGEPGPLSSLGAERLGTSLAWRDFALSKDRSVDQVLLTQIRALSRHLSGAHPVLAARPDLVTNVVGRFLYLFLLVDRGLVTQRWVDGLIGASGEPSCPDVELAPRGGRAPPWPAEQVWSLFDHVDRVMNGSVFPIGRRDRAAFDGAALHDVRRAMRHGDGVADEGWQLGLFEVSFAILRTETISAMYEVFLSEVDDVRADEGAYYTPPFLADFILDSVEVTRPIEAASRVLDPSTGSGIFLVGAYRRLLERRAPAGGWTAADLPRMRTLLTDCIHGVERNPQAANVARFSLCLTMLDYLDGEDLDSLAAACGTDRVLPDLTANILTTDAFSAATAGLGRFTHVVGNPPWGSLLKESERNDEPPDAAARALLARRVEREGPAAAFAAGLDRVRPVAERRQSELFVWLCEDRFLAPGGVLGIVVSTKTFVSRRAGAFPDALARRMRLVGLADFSHFRYRLFRGAKAPPLAIVAVGKGSTADGAVAPRPGGAGPGHRRAEDVWVYAPRLDSQAFGGKGYLWSIVASSRDVGVFTTHDLMARPRGWFDAIVLRSIDRRIAAYVRARAAGDGRLLRDLMRRTGWTLTKGASPAQTGMPADRRIDPAGYVAQLGLDGGRPTYVPLSPDEIARIPVALRRRFSGDVLLLPRGMGRFDFVPQPMLYSSTFNALVGRPDDPSAAEALALLASYLASPVADYLAGIVGSTWRLDGRRLERGDLLDLPVPFRDGPDLVEHAGWIRDPDRCTELVARRLGLEDSPFTAVVDDYRRIGNGFRDGRVPAGYDDPPPPPVIASYRDAVSSELARAFGDLAEVVGAGDPVVSSGRARWMLAVKVHGGRAAPHAAPRSPTPAEADFPGAGSITFDGVRSEVVLDKPWTLAAWSLERAYEDAGRALGAILAA